LLRNPRPVVFERMASSSGVIVSADIEQAYPIINRNAMLRNGFLCQESA
jgi:hypothetical protein